MDVLFGERLKLLREAKGWSQRDLAREARVHPQSVSKWETGARKAVGGAELLRLARALNVKPEDLVPILSSDDDLTTEPGDEGFIGRRIEWDPEDQEHYAVDMYVGDKVEPIPGAVRPSQEAVRRSEGPEKPIIEDQSEGTAEVSPVVGLSAERPTWVNELLAEVKQSGQIAADAIIEQKNEFVGTMNSAMTKVAEAMTSMANAVTSMQAEVAGLRRDLAEERAVRKRRLRESKGGGGQDPPNHDGLAG